MPKRNIHAALFDVKPKKQTGLVRLQRQINLRPEKQEKQEKRDIVPPTADQLIGNLALATDKDILSQEIENALGEHETLVADLVRAGATVHTSVRQEKQARPRLIQKDAKAPTPSALPLIDKGELEGDSIESEHKELEAFWSQSPTTTVARASFEPHYQNSFPVHATPVPPNHLTPAGRDVEVWVERLKTPVRPKTRKSWLRRVFSKSTLVVVAILVVAGGGVSVAVFRSNAFVAKQNVLQNGANALANLEEAKVNLEEFDFTEAADRFALATDDFDKAAGTLNHFGASFLSIFGDLPGFSKVRSANNLVEAGKQISQAGQGLASAFGSLYKTNFFSSLSLAGSPANPSFSEPIHEFEDTLVYAQKSIQKAQKLLEDVDIEAIPEDKRVIFEDFKEKIPDFRGYIDKAIQYADFLGAIVGDRGSKTYIVLLQNTSERRATGGFPGTYGIISFERGVLKKVFIDDIYNPDGQIKENRIPPIPIQHITPGFGMRDAAWFADFPTSARKVEEYYKLDGGADLDGVFAVDPTLVARILKIIGPIEMPEYGVTLDHTNFLAEIQDEVEYKADRAQPKKIVVDFQPKFFEKLATQDKTQWLEIMKVVLAAFEEKHILAYFNDGDLQKEVLRHGFGGEVRDTKGDYVQVVFSNIKGSKADAVTANAMKLDVQLGDETLVHTLEIIRAHNGGQSKYPFYNKENPAYVRVYVPEGAVLDGIEGIAKPNYKPLLSYSDFGFKADPDILALEQGTERPFDGVDVFTESGKTVFGFWMVVKPQKTSTVSVKYHLPKDTLKLRNDTYTLLWQKQSGGDGDQAHVNARLPQGATLISHSEGTQALSHTVLLDADLSIDREVHVVYH